MAKRSGKSRVYTWFNSRILSLLLSFLRNLASRLRNHLHLNSLDDDAPFLLLLLVLSALVTLPFFYELEAITKDMYHSSYPTAITHRNTKSFANGFMIFLNTNSVCSLPFSEGDYGRFVKFSCPVHQLWWNNLLNKVRSFLFFLFSYWGGYSNSDQLLQDNE